jgi:hypothetical protein
LYPQSDLFHLEQGGYHLESLALSATECIKVLMGEAPPKLGCAMVASEVATETVDECLKIQSTFWKSLPQLGLSSKYGKFIIPNRFLCWNITTLQTNLILTPHTFHNQSLRWMASAFLSEVSIPILVLKTHPPQARSELFCSFSPDVLKMHRSYDLYEAYGLCSIPSHDQQTSGLTKSYQNQIMVTYASVVIPAWYPVFQLLFCV